MLLSAIGIVLTFMGFGRNNINIIYGITGILIILTGSVLAVILNLGIRNGKANVEKILDAIRRG